LIKISSLQLAGRRWSECMC